MPSVAPKKSVVIAPYQVNHAMVALKMGGTDEALLSYVHFLSKRIPMAAIQFLHVLRKNSPELEYFEYETQSLIGDFDLKEEVTSNMREQVESFIRVNKERAIKYLVKEGYPLEELIYRSKLNAADLVIIGQDTEQIHHNILARNFLRKVRTNALVVPDKAMPKLEKILVPIDFSAYSLQALQTAVAINKSLEKRVKIIGINVYELPNLSFYNVDKTRQELKRIIEEDRKLAMTHFLQNQVPDIKDRKYIKTVLIEKQHFDIGFQINEFAKSNDMNMIIMGAKGHSKADLLMLGSVTERVLGLNHQIPTFIVK